MLLAVVILPVAGTGRSDHDGDAPAPPPSLDAFVKAIETRRLGDAEKALLNLNKDDGDRTEGGKILAAAVAAARDHYGRRLELARSNAEIDEVLVAARAQLPADTMEALERAGVQRRKALQQPAHPTAAAVVGAALPRLPELKVPDLKVPDLKVPDLKLPGVATPVFTGPRLVPAKPATH